METTQTPPSSGKIAFRQGLIFGVGLAIISIILTVISDFAKLGAASYILTGLSFIIAIAAYITVGFRAAKQTGRAGTGALAGLFTGLISSIISSIISLILFFTVLLNDAVSAAQKAAASSNMSADTAKNLVIGFTIGGAVFSILLALGIGAGIGALGGLWGRSKSSYQPVQYQQPY